MTAIAGERRHGTNSVHVGYDGNRAMWAPHHQRDDTMPNEHAHELKCIVQRTVRA